jgi:hypothetical protein
MIEYIFLARLILYNSNQIDVYLDLDDKLKLVLKENGKKESKEYIFDQYYAEKIQTILSHTVEIIPALEINDIVKKMKELRFFTFLSLIEKIGEEKKPSRTRNKMKVGDYFQYGKMYEEIKLFWKVLRNDGRQGLCCILQTPMVEFYKHESENWERSRIRQFLNSEYLTNFTNPELERIHSVKYIALDNENNAFSCIQDKIRLLSLNEISGEILIDDFGQEQATITAEIENQKINLAFSKVQNNSFYTHRHSIDSFMSILPVFNFKTNNLKIIEGTGTKYDPYFFENKKEP